MQHLERQFPEADKLVLVQDNLNTHQGGSFYAHLSADEAFRLSERFEMHYTPKGASWLNMVELEFSALSKQCLDRRIPCQQQLGREVLAWVDERNAKAVTVHWQFSIQVARDKLQRHYQRCRKS